MIRLQLILAFLIVGRAATFSQDTLSFNDKICNISTLLIIFEKNQAEQGTGFYLVSDWNDTEKGLGRIWLITNRHIAHWNELTPDSILFHLRRKTSTGWKPVVVNREYLKKHTRLSTNPNIDVAAIDVTEAIDKNFSIDPDLQKLFAISERDFPDSSEYKPEVGDDILAIGYPKGFYDQTNLFPIVKSGTIASSWGKNFNGYPYCLIDCHLFPGSSGSIILAKPPSIIFKNGAPLFATAKPILFLGIYSGEPYKIQEKIEFEEMTITRKDTYNLGVVWYSNLIKDLIK